MKRKKLKVKKLREKDKLRLKKGRKAKCIGKGKVGV